MTTVTTDLDNRTTVTRYPDGAVAIETESGYVELNEDQVLALFALLKPAVEQRQSEARQSQFPSIPTRLPQGGAR